MKRDAERTAVISALMNRGLMSDDPLAVWVYMLKRDGLPIISEPVGTKLKHRIVETSLSVGEIKQRRMAGLREAPIWQRFTDAKGWPDLLQTLDCVFMRDEAADYLRAIIKRKKVVDSLGGKK